MKLLFRFHIVPPLTFFFFLYHKEVVKTGVGLVERAIIYQAFLLLVSLWYSPWCGIVPRACAFCGEGFPLRIRKEDDCVSQFLVAALGSWQSITVASGRVTFGCVCFVRKYFGTILCVVWSSRRACGMCSSQMEML